MDRIANEAILEEAIKATRGTLSVVLRCRDKLSHRTPLSDLNSFIGETYSFCWDLVLEKVVAEEQTLDGKGNIPLLDVVVYPQSLPNAAPEKWLYHRPNLECICGTDDMMGWHSVSLGAVGSQFIDQPGAGKGGLQAHCDAVNADRKQRGLKNVEPLNVSLPLGGKPHPDVLFLEDDLGKDKTDNVVGLSEGQRLEKVSKHSVDNNSRRCCNGSFRRPSLYRSSYVCRVILPYTSFCRMKV